MKARFFCWLALAFLPSSLAAQTFSAFARPQKLAADETLDISFKLENGEGRNFQPPSFDGFIVVGGPSTSQSMQFINGAMSQSITYAYKLRPKSQGKKTIGSARIESGGKTLASDPLDIEVGPPGSPGSNTQNQPPREDAELSADALKEIQSNFFVRTSASKTDLYQGEQVTLSYKLYTRVNFNGFSPKPPSYQGFWVEELDPGSRQLQREVFNGQPFNSTVFKQVVLFPQKAGRVSIDPMQIETGVQVLNRGNRNTGSIFDAFFDAYKVVPYTLATDAITLHIRPLPEQNRPPQFSGAVGKFKLSARTDKDSVKTGDAVTLRIEVSGEGNMRTLPEFSLSFSPDFEVYDPKISEKIARNNGLLGGTKIWDYLLIPRNPGRYKLPDVIFSYFDPSLRQYQTERISLPELVVSGSPMGQTALAGSGKEDIKLLNQDIRYLMPEDRLRKRDVTFAGSGLFWSLFLLPALAFAGFLIRQRQQAEQYRDPESYRRKKARQMAARRLETARKLASGPDNKACLMEISRAMWGYLGDKLNLPLSELSRAEARSRLLAHDLDTSLIGRLDALLDQCEYALYAPAADSGDTSVLLAHAEQLLADFNENFR